MLLSVGADGRRLLKMEMVFVCMHTFQIYCRNVLIHSVQLDDKKCFTFDFLHFFACESNRR